MKEFKKGDKVVAVKDCEFNSFKKGDTGTAFRNSHEQTTGKAIVDIEFEKHGVKCAYVHEVELSSDSAADTTLDHFNKCLDVAEGCHYVSKAFKTIAELNGVKVGDVWRSRLGSKNTVLGISGDTVSCFSCGCSKFFTIVNIDDFDSAVLIERDGKPVEQWRTPTQGDAEKGLICRFKDSDKSAVYYSFIEMTASGRFLVGSGFHVYIVEQCEVMVN